MRRCTLVIVSLLVLTLAAPAAVASAAGPVSLVPPPGAEAGLDGEGRRAVELGARRFGPVCPGGISLTWTSFEVDYARRPGGPGVGAHVCAAVPHRAAVCDRPWLCTLVVHEYGHLAGHGHVEDPADIMHATIERLAP